ncbi:hypothetical protein CPL00146S_CDS0131 [Escherichia phage SmurfNell]
MTSSQLTSKIIMTKPSLHFCDWAIFVIKF